jgi:glyoxylase-like metal-dependent hydrolase (beta-lactamase superfamily II)
LGGLRRCGVAPEEIAYVFLTHSHLDHTLNVALFPNAKVVDGYAVYDQDRMTPLSPVTRPTPPTAVTSPMASKLRTPGAAVIPSTDVEIVPTPGHSGDHASLLVATHEGTVMVAGDLFWWLDGQPQVLDVDLPDPLATDFAQLKCSRGLALARADWIIPGHGSMQPVRHASGS